MPVNSSQTAFADEEKTKKGLLKRKRRRKKRTTFTEESSKKRESGPTESNKTWNEASVKNGCMKQDLADSSCGTTPAKKCKINTEDINSNYKIENYITEQEIDDMISKREKIAAQEMLKKSYAVLGSGAVDYGSDNVIVNSYSGEVESVVRKEFDKSTIPQYTYVGSTTSSLDIIEEETDIDDGTSVVTNISKRSICTQTDVEERSLTQCSVNNYPLRSSNLSVRCSNESLSDSHGCSAEHTIPGFQKKFLESIRNLEIMTGLTRRHINESNITKSSSAPYLSGRSGFSTENINQMKRKYVSSVTNEHLSTEQIIDGCSSTSSLCLSQYTSDNDTDPRYSTYSKSVRSSIYRSERENARKLRELCGIPTNSSQRTELLKRHSGGLVHHASLKTAFSFDRKAHSSVLSSNSDLYSVPIKKKLSPAPRSNDDYLTDWSSCTATSPASSYNTCLMSSCQSDQSSIYSAPTNNWKTTKPIRRSERLQNLMGSSQWGDDLSSSPKTKSPPVAPKRTGFVSRQGFPHRYYSTSSEVSNFSSEQSATTATSVLDEVTNSLDELARKIEAYLKRNKYCSAALKDSSSDTDTDSTVRYMPDLSATSDCNEPDYVYVKKQGVSSKVPTLKKLALTAVLGFENGIDLLSDIYFMPPQKSTHLNKPRSSTNTSCDNYSYQEQVPRCIPRKSYELWFEIPLPRQSRRLQISPSQYKLLASSQEPVDLSTLLENHQKFVQRRRYYENVKCPQQVLMPDFTIEGVHSPRTPKSCVFNVDDNYTKELLEEAANLLAVRNLRPTRHREEKKTEKRKEVQKANSANTVLESIQNRKQFATNTIDQFENNVDVTCPPQSKINTSPTPVNSDASSATKLSAQFETVRPRSFPGADDQDLRRRMYDEYMNKVAERFERRQKKVIRITSRSTSTPTMVKIFPDEKVEEKPTSSLEEEFMLKARTRLQKLGISLEDQTTEGYGKVEADEQMPKHLQELVQIIGNEDEGESISGATNHVEFRIYELTDTFCI